MYGSGGLSSLRILCHKLDETPAPLLIKALMELRHSSNAYPDVSNYVIITILTRLNNNDHIRQVIMKSFGCIPNLRFQTDFGWARLIGGRTVFLRVFHNGTLFEFSLKKSTDGCSLVLKVC